MPESRPSRVLLVFLDGVGIGPADPERNAFARAELPALRRLLGGRVPVADAVGADGRIVTEHAVLVAADATLGIAGVPQSGTGQTALLTGRNAAAEYGRHFGPWVPTGLREMLGEHNLLTRAVRSGARAAFANAYPTADLADPRIFRRPAAPPLAARAAGVQIRGLPELYAGDAVASSITNERWRAHAGDALPDVTPAEAGRRLARIAAAAEVTLFAHYDTDYAGHRGALEGAVAALERVDAFLGGLVAALPGDMLLVVGSDHGNVEDATGGHTTNPVPVLAVGPGQEAVAERVRDIAGVAPVILDLLEMSP
ncbi:MAG TPA: alkaline phosphatase family protein [Longimicrobium sp.]|nr:alkaline phosphatase family protein [Longimicrobium sp.]